MIDYLEKLDRYIAADKFEIAFEDFLEMLLETRKRAPQTEDDIKEIKNRVIILSGKFHNFNKRDKLGIIELSQATVIRNQIAYEFTELLSELNKYTEFYSYLIEQDEENCWLSAVNFNTLNATEEYIERYPEGKYKAAAKHLLYELTKIKELEKKEIGNSASINAIAIHNFNNLTDTEWWHILSPPWKKIFKTKLKISNNPSPKDFKKLFNIEKLNIHGNREIRSIEALKKLEKLKYLNISDTKIASINILKKLPNLEVIWFNYTAIHDLSPLKNSNKLIELNFQSSEVADLTPIAELENLTKIDCTLTNVNSLYPIYDMDKLAILNCETHLLSKENIENYKLMNPNVKVNMYLYS